MVTDIIVDTLNRLPELQRTLESIFERTTSPYRLHVIDDASTEGNAEYLHGLWREGKLTSVVLRNERRGILANWNMMAGITRSDVIVHTNGDVVCPKVQPDWLSRGLAIMAKYPDIGMLCLNSPMCTAKRSWRVIERCDDVVIVDRVPAFYQFRRRRLMEEIRMPEIGGTLAGIPISPTYAGIDTAVAKAALALGYRCAYLSRTYCEHIGVHSVRNGQDLSAWAIKPVNPDTLEPSQEYAG